MRFSLEVESDDFEEYLHLFTKLWRSRMLSIELAERSLSLTKQERVITKMLIKGKGNDYISDLLSISPHTVHTHRKNIFRKLNCRRVEDLTKYYTVI